MRPVVRVVVVEEVVVEELVVKDEVLVLLMDMVIKLGFLSTTEFTILSRNKGWVSYVY